MSDNVQNGRVVTVSAINFTGVAGMQSNTIAFVPTANKMLKAGDPLIVDGTERRALSVAKSPYVKDMLVVVLDTQGEPSTPA